MTKKCSLYILRLLAGKFGQICTAFPLATFSAKYLKNGFPYNFPPKVIWTWPRAKKLKVKRQFVFLSVKNKIRKDILTSLLSFFQTPLHEMVFGIKTFLHQFSFVPQDKSAKNVKKVSYPRQAEKVFSVWSDAENFNCCSTCDAIQWLAVFRF